MSTIRHSSPCPKIINPIQSRLLGQHTVPRKNHLIRILNVSFSIIRKDTLVPRFSAISLRVKAATASELSSVLFFMPYSLRFAWTEFSELDCVAGFACKEEEVMLVQGARFVVCVTCEVAVRSRAPKPTWRRAMV
jgi:hypothetical protein